jgi:hypothetical protein
MGPPRGGKVVRAGTTALLAMLAACGMYGGNPADVLTPSPQATADRQMQTRRYDGVDDATLLSASVHVLQDLGFTIKVSDTQLGLIEGTKEQEAKASGQKAGLLFIEMLLIALASSQGSSAPQFPQEAPPEEQTVNVMLVIAPAGPDFPRSRLVRVTFSRWVRQPLQMVAGTLREPGLYESFFQLRSKSIFLEGHQL